MPVTPTEGRLSELCANSFLRLWCFPNPARDDGKELCDALVVFGEYIIIFFDRERVLRITEDQKTNELNWKRWQRKCINNQIDSLEGAERYIKSGRSIFLNRNKHTSLDAIVPKNAKFIKILVAHGAHNACKAYRPENIYGSLAVIYSKSPEIDFSMPFVIQLDSNNPVHVLDGHNFALILRELDTISDFISYIIEKERAISQVEYFNYCGEEDLLGYYMRSFDKISNNRVLIKDRDATGFMVEEGFWQSFVKDAIYRNTKKSNQSSYLWDRFIEKLFSFISLAEFKAGRFHQSDSPLFQMAKEPRFYRRMLSNRLNVAFKEFPAQVAGPTRKITLISSLTDEVVYIFVQIHGFVGVISDITAARHRLLEVSSFSALDRLPDKKKAIGFIFTAPKFSKDFDVEVITLNREDLSVEDIESLKLDQEKLKILRPETVMQVFHENEFIPPSSSAPRSARRNKVGRNTTCPCGSGKKYKYCCI
ncbi:YecA family protein [Roseococcus microcysteis]|uniref:YecA family protein n=1 Tax=Roseococcus microcysteis TaxID=2771361 RepID=UPI00168B8B77|nr:SEC-C metal-binding domain-containing protein [Roseococcus microcysteis]